FADPGKGVVGIEYQETPCPADFQQPLNPSVQKPSSLLRQYPHDLDAQHAAAKAFGQKDLCICMWMLFYWISIMADTQDGGEGWEGV
ncbi:hypothetical protein QJQ45_030531, partial [Haematococcus lacustris]